MLHSYAFNHIYSMFCVNCSYWKFKRMSLLSEKCVIIPRICPTNKLFPWRIRLFQQKLELALNEISTKALINASVTQCHIHPYSNNFLPLNLRVCCDIFPSKTMHGIVKFSKHETSPDARCCTHCTISHFYNF